MALNTQPIDTSRYERVDTSTHLVSAPPTDPEPDMSPFLKSPLPPVNSGPDNQRQFHYSGVPQYRIIPPPSNPTTVVQPTTTTTVNNNSSTTNTIINNVGLGPLIFVISPFTVNPVYDGNLLSKAGGTFVMTLTGNIATSTWKNLVPGAVYTIRFLTVTGHSVTSWGGVGTGPDQVNQPIDQGQGGGIWQQSFVALTDKTLSAITPGVML